MSNTEIGYLFEELMDVNRELSQAYEELEVYKKALKMACETLAWDGTDTGVNKYIDYYLQKARTEV